MASKFSPPGSGLALTLAAFGLALAACGDGARPVTTADQAIVIAHDRFRGTAQGHGPFAARMSNGVWIVTAGSGPDAATVGVDAKTGAVTTLRPKT